MWETSSFFNPDGTALGRASSEISLWDKSNFVNFGQRQGKFGGIDLIELYDKLSELSPSNVSSLPSDMSHSIVRLALQTFNLSYNRVCLAIAGVIDAASSVSLESDVCWES